MITAYSPGGILIIGVLDLPVHNMGMTIYSMLLVHILLPFFSAPYLRAAKGRV